MDVEAPRVTPRQRRRADKLERILDTAFTLVVRDGVDAFTIRDLAQEMGFAVGAVYRYYRSKDALLAALQVRVIRALGASIERQRAGAAALADDRGLDPRPADLLALISVGTLYARLSSTDPETFQLLSMVLGDPRRLLEDEDASEVVHAALSVLTQVSELFERAAARGALEAGPPLDRAVVFWSALQGLAQNEKLQRVAPRQLDGARLVPELITTLLRGWGATRDDLDRATTHQSKHPQPQLQLQGSAP